MELGAEEPLYLCVYWQDAGLFGQARAIERRGANCVMPTTPCLLEARTVLLQSLQEIVTGFGLINQWCVDGGNVLDVSLLENSIPHTSRAIELMDDVGVLLSACHL